MYTIKKIIIKELSEDEFDGVFQIYKEGEIDYNFPIPPPPDESIKKAMLHPNFPDTKPYRFILKNSNKVVSYCGITTNTGDNNRNIASISLRTLKNYRLNGFAKQLLQLALKEISAEVDTFTINIISKDTSTTSLDKYLKNIGGKLAISDRRSGSKIKTFDVEKVVEKAELLRKKAVEKGYSLRFVKNYEFKSDPVIDYNQYLKALESIWNDMPRDDLSMEDEELTEEVHQYFIETGRDLNEEPWTFVAIHDQSNKVAGLTETWLPRTRPYLAIQDDTGVVKDHRGNGLGLMLKYQMLAKLLTDETTQEVEYWTTHNAFSNEHMLRINNELRYELLSTINIYEFERSVLENYLYN